MAYDITCNVCGRILGSSSVKQQDFSCGKALVTHQDGTPIEDQKPLTESEIEKLNREVENLRREIELVKSLQK